MTPCSILMAFLTLQVPFPCKFAHSKTVSFLGSLQEIDGAPLADGVVAGWAAQPLARGRVSGAGCVPGTESRLGEQLFRSPFSLCRSRESGRGYACFYHDSGFYHDSPHRRLLIRGFHREGAVPRRNEAAKGALLACIATSFRGSPHERLTSERWISEAPGDRVRLHDSALA